MKFRILVLVALALVIVLSTVAAAGAAEGTVNFKVKPKAKVEVTWPGVVDFGEVDPGVTTAPIPYDIRVKSNTVFFISRGAPSASWLTVNGPLTGPPFMGGPNTGGNEIVFISEAGQATVPWTAPAGVDLNASVTYTIGLTPPTP